MEVIIPTVIMSIWALLVAGTWITHFLLRRRFVAKYPEIAREHITYWDSWGRHPDKLLFFLKSASTPYLRADPEIWKLRRLFICLLFITGGYLVLAMLGILVLGILMV